MADRELHAQPQPEPVLPGELINAELLADPGSTQLQVLKGVLFRVVQDAALEPLYNDAWDEVKIFVGVRAARRRTDGRTQTRRQDSNHPSRCRGPEPGQEFEAGAVVGPRR